MIFYHRVFILYYMGCNCKGATVLKNRSFVNNKNVSTVIGSKWFFTLSFITLSPILIPLVLLLSFRSIIIGKPINVIKVVTLLVPKNKKKTSSNEQQKR